MNFLRNLISTFSSNSSKYVTCTSNDEYNIEITSDEPIDFEKVMREVDEALIRHINPDPTKVDSNNLVIKPKYLEYQSPSKIYTVVIKWDRETNSGSPEQAKEILDKAKEDIDKKKQLDEEFNDRMKRVDENLREVMSRLGEDVKTMTTGVAMVARDLNNLFRN